MVDAPIEPDRTKEIGPKPPGVAPGPGPDEREFQSLMQGSPLPTKGVSPLEISPEKMSASMPTLDSLMAQIEATQNRMKEVEQSLNFSQLKLKKAQERLLSDKFESAHSDIQGAAKAAGASILPTTADNKMEPIARFLSYVSDGQNQLAEVKSSLATMAKSGKINPSDMLLIQVKLAQAQQEIEFSSMLLSKVVDAIQKTVNIQIQ